MRNDINSLASGRPLSLREAREAADNLVLTPNQRHQYDRLLAAYESRELERLRGSCSRGFAAVKDQHDRLAEQLAEQKAAAEQLIKDVKRGRVEHRDAIARVGKIIRWQSEAIELVDTMRDLEAQTLDRAEQDPADLEAEQVRRFGILQDKGVTVTADYLDSDDDPDTLFGDGGGVDVDA